jgi:RNA polymerase sigma factor for flagellar operon FliA
MAALVKTREQLIEECQGLVRSLAAKIQQGLPRHLDLDDLISYGQVGLAEAARDFDPGRGGQFTTFAYYRIRGAIYDGLSKMSWVNRSHYNRIKYQQMADDVLRLESDGQADAANAGVDDGLRWLKSVTGALAIVYLSTHAGHSDDSEGVDVEDRLSPSPQAVAIDRETHGKLRQLIDELPAEAQSLIRATYFEGLTLTEAGQRLGIGKAWASRLHAKALQRLARSLRLAGIVD